MKKNWINLNKKDDVIEEEVIDLEKEETEVKTNFFMTHKKGLIIGGIGALLAGGAALLLRSGSEDEDDDFEELDVSDDSDDESSEESES